MKNNNEKLKYHIAFQRALGLTLTRYQNLKKFFNNDFEAAWNSDVIGFQKAKIDRIGIEKLIKLRSKTNPDQEVELLEKAGAKAVSIECEAYPEPLSNIHNPPVLLFCKGEFKPSDFPSVSVVGSRHATPYGVQALENIVGFLAQEKITIVSGLAYGIDTLAHKKALKMKSRTIGVLGCGIDDIYPKMNKYWVEKMVKEDQGMVISEFLPGVKARPEYFPQRNRIVAGLSTGTLVIEAALKSGSLITAKLAADFNREVLAVPGNIFDQHSKGTNEIISNNIAHACTSGEQVFSHLGFIKKTQDIVNEDLSINDNELMILKAFGGHSRKHIDDLSKSIKHPQTNISADIMMMELRGLVKNIGEQVYVRLV